MRTVLTAARRTGLALLCVVALVLVGSAAYLGWAHLRPVRLALSPSGTDVVAADVRTHVETWAAARPSGLPPLVLVPGFAESTYAWSRAAPLLAADRDVVAYDVRGYGATHRVPPYTLDADVDQLAGLLAALHLDGPRRPVVVGHSSGAAIALGLALRSPGAVAGVVAANGDGTPYGVPSGPRALLLDPVASAAATAVVRHRGPIRSLVTAQCGPGCPVDDAAIDRWRAPFLSPGGVDALLAIVRRPLIGLTYAQEEAVRVPVGIVRSADDESFDAASATATAARLHTDRLAVLPGARHLALLGDPEAFAAAVRAVLR